MPAYNFLENTLYQLVDPPGGFGWYKNGKMYVDDLAKIQAAWLVATGGDVKGKVAAIKIADWNSVKHYSLKNELIYSP
jgi:hypothetical protein